MKCSLKCSKTLPANLKCCKEVQQEWEVPEDGMPAHSSHSIRDPQHLKWLPGAGEEAAMATGAQAQCTLGKLRSKGRELHPMQPPTLRCTSSTSMHCALQEPNVEAKQHRNAALCNTQEYSSGAWASSLLGKAVPPATARVCV